MKFKEGALVEVLPEEANSWVGVEWDLKVGQVYVVCKSPEGIADSLSIRGSPLIYAKHRFQPVKNLSRLENVIWGLDENT